MFAKNFCQRSHYSVLNMTLYDIPKVLPVESMSVSFYGNGKHFSHVLLDIASTVIFDVIHNVTFRTIGHKPQDATVKSEILQAN